MYAYKFFLQMVCHNDVYHFENYVCPFELKKDDPDTPISIVFSHSRTYFSTSSPEVLCVFKVVPLVILVVFHLVLLLIVPVSVVVHMF